MMMTATATERSSDSREAILEASARVVGRRGVAETRLADIADEAGVSIGLLQHHFRTRDRLLSETFETRSAELLDTISRLAVTEPNPTIRLRKLLRFLCSNGVAPELEQEWAVWLAYWLASTRDPSLARQSAAIYQEWQNEFLRTLNSGVTEGEFVPRRPVPDIVDELLAMLDGLMIRVLLRHPDMPPARVEQLLVGFVEDSLGMRLPSA